ncbi:dolichol kinase [Diaporthe eres]|uniref:dolichol kinase n=1 Tax=Diaporthe eres TaxID=83184 RepID=A0ABR1P2P8_DIAER
MSSSLKPPRPEPITVSPNDELEDQENLRTLSRSPHPYLRHKWELLEPSDSFIPRATSIPTHTPGDARDQLIPSPAFTKDSTPNTDSGTEADDEIFVKRLPAPRARLHKGLRGRPEPPSGVATPLLTPSFLEGDLDTSRGKERRAEDEKRHRAENARRRKELIRRATEVLILSGLGRLVVTNPDVSPVVASHREEVVLQGALLESGSDNEDSDGASGCTTDEDDIKKASVPRRASILQNESGLNEFPGLKKADTILVPPGKEARADLSTDADGTAFQSPSRRHTLPFVDKILSRSKTHTPSGRRKRSSSTTVRAFFSLTQSQATTRKWLYAAWLYVGIVVVILGGVRVCVQYQALDGSEPIGWALGYVFGDLPGFRFQVVQANMERWICLPYRADDDKSCSLGWVQHLRDASIGEANTRLVLAAYWVTVIAIGLLVVFRLSPFYEVDTRRKVFHFMMVAMFLPAIYVDPGWCALALAIVLAIFLLLDLLRASQLPPLSKPITTFLHPYTDGRDHCGPVVISHIFLLIGCAIPLWLSLASLPRTGTGYRRGWEVPTRDLSMVAGVVCVGLGDAAASLIGRRYGHHKWLWKGGKSIEGSVAFAVAVSIGLLAANIWLKIGGWPITSRPEAQGAPHGLDAVWAGLIEWDWLRVIGETGLCATTASLTEAVLTGGNDNVVVPVVLWTCVKSTGL